MNVFRKYWLVMGLNLVNICLVELNLIGRVCSYGFYGLVVLLWKFGVMFLIVSVEISFGCLVVRYYECKVFIECLIILVGVFSVEIVLFRLVMKCLVLIGCGLVMLCLWC